MVQKETFENAFENLEKSLVVEIRNQWFSLQAQDYSMEASMDYLIIQMTALGIGSWIRLSSL